MKQISDGSKEVNLDSKKLEFQIGEAASRRLFSGFVQDAREQQRKSFWNKERRGRRWGGGPR